MSHFVTMVIGDDPEKQLEPFNENIEVDEYASQKVSEEDKKRMLDHYGCTDFEECYKLHGEDWNDNDWRKNEDGEWWEYSTYNPKSKWDWYVLGGRWSGRILKLKEGAESGIEGEKSFFSDTHGIDAALKKDIDFEAMYKEDEEWAPYAILKDGEWISRGEMGYFGISFNETMTKGEWSAKVKELIESLPGNTLISMYDLHI